jgi:uncharacterized protein (TIGR02421 family)
MRKLSVGAICSKIENGEVFSAITPDLAFAIEIDKYVPFVCTAIHNGSNLARDLKSKINLSRQERWYEEDPCTGSFISSLPIRMTGFDSRYEYDLNRPPGRCVYNIAWGKRVWKSPLSEKQKNRALHKHGNFYRVLDALMLRLTKEYQTIIVFDIHAYNWQRIEPSDPPVFNIGTHFIKDLGKPLIEHWQKNLGEVRLPRLAIGVEKDAVFYGKGYLAKYISGKHKRAVVLPTEIKKVYCNEENGDEYPEVILALRTGLKKAIVKTVFPFLEETKKTNGGGRDQLLSSQVEDAVLETDNRLFMLCRHLEVLDYITPINIEARRKVFLKNGGRTKLGFRYRQITLDPHLFRRSLYTLPLASIKEVSLEKLYRDAVEDQSNTVELLSSRERPEFLYNSLRVYGRPDQESIELAKSLLANENKEPHFPDLNAEEVLKIIRKVVKEYGLTCKLEVSASIGAKALYVPRKNLVKIQKGASFSLKEAMALAHHEVGLHALTTANSKAQKLRLLQVGLAANVSTQEGLAVYNEYLSGNLTARRLEDLALRVLAIDRMVQGESFTQVFDFLKYEYELGENRAFNTCMRAFRSGGFTKDHLYLKGFLEVLKQSGRQNLTPLLVGKTSIEYLSLLKELIERRIVSPPVFIPGFWKDKKISRLNREILTHFSGGRAS